MLYIYLPVLYYHGNLYVTEGAYPSGRGFPLSHRDYHTYIYSKLSLTCIHNALATTLSAILSTAVAVVYDNDGILEYR